MYRGQVIPEGELLKALSFTGAALDEDDNLLDTFELDIAKVGLQMHSSWGVRQGYRPTAATHAGGQVGRGEQDLACRVIRLRQPPA